MTFYDRLCVVVAFSVFMLLLVLLSALSGCNAPPVDAATTRAMEHGPGYAPAYPPLNFDQDRPTTHEQ